MEDIDAYASTVTVDHSRQAWVADLDEQAGDAALVLARVATDSGVRTSLDEAIAEFGFDKAELEAELDADLAAGRE